MVLRVCDLPGHLRSQLTLYPSDNFDCGDWLLFEVRALSDRRTTLLMRGTDSGPSSWIGEGSGSS